MSKKANPTIIGTFVFAALVIGVVGTILLGNLTIKKSPLHCILYFTGSLHGLDKGAPVTLRGVQIGRVTDIQIDFNRQQSNYTIPVYIEINQQANVADAGRLSAKEQILEKSMLHLINSGLRAQLKMRSLVTGKLYIDLAFYPETQIILHGPETKLIEIPTLPSGLEQLTQSLEDLPLNDLLSKVNQLIDGINKITNTGQIGDTLDSLQTSLHSFEQMITRLEKTFPELVEHADQSLNGFDQLTLQATSLAQQTNTQITTLGKQGQQTLLLLQQAITTTQASLKKIETIVNENSDISYDLSLTMHDIQQAARSIKNLSDTLQRSPEALLFGIKEKAQKP